MLKNIRMLKRWDRGSYIWSWITLFQRNSLKIKTDLFKKMVIYGIYKWNIKIGIPNHLFKWSITGGMEMSKKILDFQSNITRVD